MSNINHHRAVRFWLAALAAGICGGMGCAIGDLVFASHEVVFVDGAAIWPSRVPIYICAAVGGGVGGIVSSIILRITRVPGDC